MAKAFTVPKVPKNPNPGGLEQGAASYAQSHTDAIVGVLIHVSDGAWTKADFMSKTVDDFRYLAGWLVAAAYYDKRDRYNWQKFDALVGYVVHDIASLI